MTNLDDTKQQLEKVMTSYPELTYFGFGCFNGFRNKINNDKIEQLRKELQNAVHEIDLCRTWIRSHCIVRKTVDKRRTSYWLKHRIEDSVGRYISNGSCIAAMIIEGYKAKIPLMWGPNCAFNAKYNLGI